MNDFEQNLELALPKNKEEIMSLPSEASSCFYVLQRLLRQSVCSGLKELLIIRISFGSCGMPFSHVYSRVFRASPSQPVCTSETTHVHPTVLACSVEPCASLDALTFGHS